MKDQVKQAEEIFGTKDTTESTVMDIDFGSQGEGGGFPLLAEDIYVLQVNGADPETRDNRYKAGETEHVVKWEFGVYPLTADGKVRDIEKGEWEGGKRLIWATTKITPNNMKDGTPAAFKQIVAALLGLDPLDMKEKLSLDFKSFVGEKIRGYVTFAVSDNGKKFNKVKSYSKLDN